ncbi:TIGR03557 family F420-dependent LLM class oxidoreductase [Planotetraspora sp. GP83]|uniref:TIGR03557 family F420-dependent LLM class oxidoreductase n=1 Tax=Planotetraspora sp. GP83 TaxID=3156264 RepID=UPI0035113D4B
MDLLVWIIFLIWVAGWVAGFAVAARRLLGLRFGIVRTLLGGGFALLIAGPIAQALAGSVSRDDPSITPLWFLILAMACALLASMVFLVIAEALAPTGSIPGPIEIVRGLRSRLLRSRRYFQITRILVRHGLGPYLRGRDPDLGAASSRRRLARSLREALDEGGVTFVKLGQILSTRSDLLPAEFVEELRLLQDKVAPAPWDEIEQVLAGELGMPVEQAFAVFEREPLAAASIAQVHLARLVSGEEVVVKVQRPGVAAVVERDLDIVARLARTAERRTRWARGAGVGDLARGFAEALREELDFRIETANMAAVAASSPARGGRNGPGGSEGRVRMPTPYPELGSRRVLVMERLHGTPFGMVEARLAEAGGEGLDREELARTLLHTLLEQIMLHGVFHADPHPGNIMLLADGGLALLDFGSVGRLDASVRASLQRLLAALDQADPLGASDALLEIVPRPDEIDERELERAIGRFMARHLVAGATPDVQMFGDLFRVVFAHGLSVPPEVAAVFRALATIEGTLTRLAPGFDIVEEARAFAGRHFVWQGDQDHIRAAVTKEVVSLLPMLRRLPRRVERIVGAAENGRLSVNVRLFADARDRRHVTGLLHQVLLTVLAATAGIMAVLLLGAQNGPRVTAAVGLYQLIGYNLLVVSAILALRVWWASSASVSETDSACAGEPMASSDAIGSGTPDPGEGEIPGAVGRGRGMAEIGFTMMSEQTPARQLVDDVVTAERVGFDYAVISDHYFPWLEEMGHSPYAWSVLGAAAHATERLPLMTYVTCPIMRYHPAVVAQKAATMGVLSEGRFTLGLGAGENLNEHVVGHGWPPVNTRHEMFREAIDIIRELFDGGYRSYRGEFFDIDSAKLFDLPDRPVPLAVAASGDQSLDIAAEYGDALVATDPERELVEKFAASGGQGKPVYGQLAISYDPDRDAAGERAHRLWRWSLPGWKVMAELPAPVNFAAATQTVRPEDVAKKVPCGPDVEAVVEAVRQYTDAGFTHVALVQIGSEHQRRFFDWSEKELLPALRRL